MAYFQVAADNFSGADANPIGGPWTTVGGGPHDMQVVSHTAEATALTNSSEVFYSALTFQNDQYAEITVGAHVADGNHATYVTVRHNGAGNSNYNATEFNGTLLLRVTVSGTPTTLATVTQTVTNGDVLRLEVQGSALTMKLNGIVQATATDTTFASGSPGMGIFIVAGALSDDQISLWAGGNILFPAWPNPEWSSSTVGPSYAI